ncbi:MAG: Galactofuranose ABC transporter, permease protein 2 [uncultured Paraburkholderia sp.]|nr:MAG: Galactofuranose ABC transporter, permease protein 2 [uncultured Paraburkholderia sp.]
MRRFFSACAHIVDPRTLPIAVTILLFCALFGFGSVMYTGFFSWQVLLDLLVDNAFLLIVAIGMTFVIVSGGIDLSVGSIVALTTIIEAVLSERLHMSVWIILPIVLLMGTVFGAVQGALIHFFRLQAFIVTLAGMFFARGLCFLITTQSITITDPTFRAISAIRLDIGIGSVTANVLIAFVALVGAIYIAHFTRFGRNVYAVGGNAHSALLMGLPVAHTRIGVYALSGFCSALGGAVFTFYVLSGYGLQGQGMELDAIAATVIGGTLLTGGVGYVIGSLFGVGILGTIQTLITFDGTLSSWWTRIVIGALLCAFCLLQRLIERHAKSVRRHRRCGDFGTRARAWRSFNCVRFARDRPRPRTSVTSALQRRPERTVRAAFSRGSGFTDRAPGLASPAA